MNASDPQKSYNDPVSLKELGNITPLASLYSVPAA